MLVCNAGISGPKTKHEDGDPSPTDFREKNFQETFEGWGSVFETNVSAVYFTGALLSAGG